MIRLATSRLKRQARFMMQRQVQARSNPERIQPILKPGMIFLLAVWLGLATGLLELGLQFARRHLVNSAAPGALQLNRHALWMVPISNGLIFAACGAVIGGMARLLPRRLVVAVGVFGLCFLAATALLFVYRGLTSIAYSALAAGIACWATPRIVAMAKRQGQIVRHGLPRLIGLVALLFGLNYGREELGELRLSKAPPGSPNVLLIVLNTVRTKSLSVYGYKRQTSPHLAALAKHGARFDHARTAAAWTLPSHASMFTGRWAYELSTRLNRPLDGVYPTLAEYLKDHGYDTAGFAANTIFCTSWFGLDRGFLHYEDVAITPVEILRSSHLGRCVTRKFFPSASCRDRPNAYFNRKDAATINQDFLTWLSRRPKGRPFFAFLNYYDAHDPYLVPAEATGHFGLAPHDVAEIETLRDWQRAARPDLPERTLTMARDCYDDCILYLDGQLGRLLAQLDSTGLLDNTLVVVTSDHGELLGEHQSFGHGQSLYREVAEVPLLIVAPRRIPAGRVIAAPVSLRDIPATVVDLAGLARTSPFPGRSLARHWSAAPADAAQPDELLLTETVNEAVPPPAGTKPARALAAEGRIYIRGKDGHEEIYDIVRDPTESHDLSNTPGAQPLLARFRETMRRIDDEALALRRPDLMLTDSTH